jgi:thiol:disulfide interchange protein DsbD
MDFSSLTSQLNSAPLAAMFTVFIGGILTSLNPCIYPMIPITVALIGGQTVGAAPPSRGRILALSLTYAGGLALVYASLGLVAGMTRTMFGTISTNPALYFLMANVLIVGALVMLDVLPLRLPAWLSERASSAGTGGRFSGVFIMGAMSGFVAAPCGAPVFAAVLTWVSTTQSAAMGFVYLLLFSLGMSALLVVAGVFTGLLARLPRPGGWMSWVKRGFAIVMIAAAEYYLFKMGQLVI